MKITKLVLYLCLIYSVLILNACGSGGAGASGNAVVLTTSNIVANANTSSIDSDIAKDTPTSTGIHKDTVSVAILSTITAKPGITPLPIQVNSVTVSYVAKNGGPVLATETYSLGNTLAAGGSLTLSIDVATLNQKSIVFDNFPAAVSSVVYSADYEATLTFNVSEVGFGGASGSPVTHTTIHFANFTDS